MKKLIPLFSAALLLGVAPARAYGQTSYIVQTDIVSQPTSYEISWRDFADPNQPLHSGSGASAGIPRNTGSTSSACSISYKISNLTYHGTAAPSTTIVSFHVYYKAQIIAQLVGSDEAGVSGGSITASADIRDQHPSGTLSSRGTSDAAGGNTSVLNRFIQLNSGDWAETEPGVWVVSLRTIDSVTAHASVSYNSGLPLAPPGVTQRTIAEDGGFGSAVEAQEDFTVTITP